MVDDQSFMPMEPGHLTACTLLALERGVEYEAGGWREIKDHDVLPPKLARLFIVDATHAAPLLALTRLGKLHIHPHCNMAAQELRKLSALARLTYMALGFTYYRGGGGWEAPSDAAPAWGDLPALRAIELCRVNAPGAGALPRAWPLTQLTSLEIELVDCCGRTGELGPFTPLALATWLPPGLRALELRYILDPDTSEEAAAFFEDDYLVLSEAIGRLGRLESLVLDTCGPLLAPRVAAPLGRLPRLRSLKLGIFDGAEVDACVGALFAGPRSLPQLTLLDTSGRRSDAVAKVAAGRPHLTIK